jgi:hypothetical protein
MNEFRVYTKNKILCSWSTYMHIASILLNAAVAVSKLSHMPCCVQTAFVEWVCTVIHHDKWNVFLLLNVLFDTACSCHYAVHVALFYDSVEKCVVKNFVCSDVTLCYLVEIYQHMWGTFCCTLTILTLVWEQLASSKSSLLSIRLHSAVSHRTLFLIATASRILHVYIVCCWFSHSKVL